MSKDFIGVFSQKNGEQFVLANDKDEAQEIVGVDGELEKMTQDAVIDVLGHSDFFDEQKRWYAWEEIRDLVKRNHLLGYRLVGGGVE